MIFNMENNNKLDIAALESVSFANNYNNYIFELILEYVEGSNVLDFGAGYGQFTQFIQQKNKNVVAIEVNEKAISKLDELQIPNYKSLDTLPKKFETVVSLNVLEHIDDDLSVLKELVSHLENEGRIILYLPASMLVWSELDELVNHKRRYSRKLINNLAIGAELKIDKIFFVDFIGWAVIAISRILRVNLDFSKKRIIFYDRFIFKNFKFLDVFFNKIIGKNLLIILSKNSN